MMNDFNLTLLRFSSYMQGLGIQYKNNKLICKIIELCYEDEKEQKQEIINVLFEIMQKTKMYNTSTYYENSLLCGATSLDFLLSIKIKNFEESKKRIYFQMKNGILLL